MSNVEENKDTVKKMQKVIMGILLDLDKFCRENHIRYFLSGGTLLGTVRHKGFIPWDDDGDIQMPRPDYNKFISLFSKSDMMEKYGLGSLSTDENWTIQYVRVWDKNTKWNSRKYNLEEMGVFVDIFPIDGVPSNKIMRKLLFARMKVNVEFGKEANRVEFSDNNRFILLRKLVGLYAKRRGQRYYSKKMNAIAMKYDFEKCKLVASTVPAHYGDREVLDHDEMSKAIFMEFEGHKFPVPLGYERYLRQIYGDYMQIPKDAQENGYSHLDKWIVEFEDEQ